MNKIIILLSFLLISNLSYASLTVSNVPKTKTGGTSPALEDSSISNPSSGNVGIGSTNPGAKLDVNGTVRATLFSGNLTAAGSDTQVTFNDATASSGNAGFVFQKTTGTVTATHLIGEGSGITALSASNVSGVIPIANLATGTPTGSKFIRDDGVLAVPAGGGISGLTTNVLSKATSSTAIGNSQVFDNGTNVGVGSTNPGAYLDINGAERIMGQWNIGVGTVSPAQSLSVNGNASFNGGISTSTWTDPINDWNAAGITTTTTGTISISTNSLVVASASGWSVGMGIAIANAGTGGNTELITYITGISGTTFTLNDNAIATATTQTVNHDETRALQSAFDSGKNVHIRAGNYNVTSGLTITHACLVMGDGNRGRNVANGETLTTMGTVIVNRSTTANIITITIGDTKLSNFAIEQSTSITPTAGYAVTIGDGATKILNTGLSYLTIYATIGGIYINGTGVSIGYYNNNWIQTKGSTSYYALLIINAGPAGDLFWTDNYFSLVTTGTNPLVYIRDADTEAFVNNKFINGNPCLKIDDNAGGGAVFFQRFVGNSFENGGSNGYALLSSTNANTIYNITFSGNEFGAGGSGPGLSLASSVSHITVSDNVFNSLSVGIAASTTSGYLSITDNTFYNITNSNINITGTNKVYLSGNIYDNAGTYVVNTGTPFTSIVYSDASFDTANVGIGTYAPPANLYVKGTSILTGAVSFVGIGTTTPQQICRKSDGTIGYYDGTWAGSCN